MSVFNVISHRPYPLPKLPWLMTQTWTDVVFVHWPVEASSIRSSVPDGMEIDIYGGQAWISVVFFFSEGSRLDNHPEIFAKRKSP